MVGGYVMIDCTGLDVASLGTVAGLCEKIASAYNTKKNVILCNIKNGNAILSAVATVITPQSGGAYHFSVNSNVYNITNADVVTAAQ